MKISAQIIVPVRKAKHRRAYAEVAVDVKEAACADAPIVATMPAPPFPDRIWRLFDGALWKPKEDVNRSIIRVEAAGERPGLYAMKAGSHGLSLNTFRFALEWSAFDMMAEPSEAEVTRSAHYAAVLDVARDTLIIDGEFYERSPGPVMTVTLGLRRLAAVAWTDRWLGWNDMKRRAALTAYHRQHEILDDLRASGFAGAHFTIGPKPDLSAAPLLAPFDDVANAAECTAWLALHEMQQLHLMDIPRGAADAYCRLREIMADRWPNLPIVFNGREYEIWPHAFNRTAFARADEMAGPLQAIAEADLPQLRKSMTSRYALFAAQRVQSDIAARAIPAEDLAAMTIGM